MQNWLFQLGWPTWILYLHTECASSPPRPTWKWDNWKEFYFSSGSFCQVLYRQCPVVSLAKLIVQDQRKVLTDLTPFVADKRLIWEKNWRSGIDFVCFNHHGQIYHIVFGPRPQGTTLLEKVIFSRIYHCLSKLVLAECEHRQYLYGFTYPGARTPLVCD